MSSPLTSLVTIDEAKKLLAMKALYNIYNVPGVLL
jgi:hypothetical protein